MMDRWRRRILSLAALGAAGAAAYAAYKWVYDEDGVSADEEPSASTSGAAQGVLPKPRGPPASTELDAEAHLQHHFDSIQEIADSTTLPSLLPALSRALLQAADVETPLQRLRDAKQGTVQLDHGDKLAAWEELTVAAFTRALGAVWLLPLLELFVRAQLCILGRHLYLECAVQGSNTQRRGNVPRLSAASQERFLSYAEFLSQQGATRLLGVLRRAAARVLAEVPLGEPLVPQQVQGLLARIDAAFAQQAPAAFGARGWAAVLLPEPAALRESLGPSAPNDRAVLLGAEAVLVDGAVVEQLAAEAEAVASGAEFAGALQACAAEALNAASARLTATQGEQALPLAKAVPLVSALGADLLAPSIRPSLASLEPARTLSARVYGCCYC